MILSLIFLLILIITWILIIAIAIIVYTSSYFNNFWRGFLAYYSEIFYQIRNIPTTITFLNYIFKKYLRNSIITFIIISIFISFYNDIIMIIDKYWVKSIITHLNKHTFLQYTLLNGPLIIEYAYSLYYKSKPKKIHIIILILLTSLYYSDYWIFLNSFNLFIIAYWLLELSYLFIFFHNYGKKKDNKSIFIIDSPLKPNNKNEKDTLGRDNLVETSAKNLRNSFFKQGAFYVAVTGEWGSGKTSFTNLLTDKMLSDEKDIIKIEINTWRTEDPNLFTKYFFDTLNKELSVYIPELSKLLPKYLAIIANSCDNKYLKGASKILDSFNNNNNDPYESIKKVLIKAKKKILVVIDDIDRLNAEEIYQILKLVRNTVDFPYMQFIMNFDKEYVVECLGKFICEDTIDKGKSQKRSLNLTKAKTNNYLNKFINLEIELPSYEILTLCLILERLIRTFEKKYFKLDINYELIYLKNNKNQFHIGIIFNNIREIYKFYNNFILIVISAKNNSYNTVVYEDLLLLLLLKFKYNNAYQILKNEPLQILDINKDDPILKYYQFNNLDINNSKIFNFDIENYETLSTILRNLFPKNKEIRFDNKIRNCNSYFNYFSYRETYENFNLKEFNYIFTNQDTFFEIMFDKINLKSHLFENSTINYEIDNLAYGLISLTLLTIESSKDENILKEILLPIKEILIKLLKVNNANLNNNILPNNFIKIYEYQERLLLKFFTSEQLSCKLYNNTMLNIYWENIGEIILITATIKEKNHSDTIKLIEFYIQHLKEYVECTNILSKKNKNRYNQIYKLYY